MKDSRPREAVRRLDNHTEDNRNLGSLGTQPQAVEHLDKPQPADTPALAAVVGPLQACRQCHR